MREIRVRRAFWQETRVQITDEQYETDMEGAASEAADRATEWTEWGIERDEDIHIDCGQVSVDAEEEEEEGEDEEDA